MPTPIERRDEPERADDSAGDAESLMAPIQDGYRPDDVEGGIAEPVITGTDRVSPVKWFCTVHQRPQEECSKAGDLWNCWIVRDTEALRRFRKEAR